MKTRISYYLLFCLCVTWVLLIISGCDTASNTEDPDLSYFMKYYGGDGNQYAVDMLSLTDGTFLLLGNHAETATESDVYVIRANAEGDVIWERTFSSGISIAKDIEPTDDGNFIVLADFQTAFNAPTDIKLLKISPEGALLDSVYFGIEVANDFSRTVTTLNDGGFIVSGTTEYTATFNLVNSPDPDLGDFFNYRFDRNLNQLSESAWSPVSPGFGGKLDVAVKAIEIPVDTGFNYYVFGHSNIELTDKNPNKKLGVFYFLRNSSGGESSNFYPGHVNPLHDTRVEYVGEVPSNLGQGIIVVGSSQSNLGVSEIFFARMRKPLTFQDIDNDAILYTNIPIGRNVRGVSASSSIIGESGYLIVGNEVRGTGALNLWLTKIDQSGQVRWSTTFGSEAEDDMAAAVTELPDGKVVVLGTMGLADNQFKIAFIKLNRSGQLLK